ncbi:MAG: hypothetical protein WCJ55_05180, partial [Chloroflexales bacterium]
VERGKLKPRADQLMAYEDLCALATRDDASLFNQHGEPTQLSRLATNVYAPPDLWQFLPEPRISWLSQWERYHNTALRELERLDGLSRYLDMPLVAPDGQPLPLPLPDGTGTFTYDQEPLLREWQRWRIGMDEGIGHPEHGEVMRRVSTLAQEFDQTMWGALPQSLSLSGTRYARLVLEFVREQMAEIQGGLQHRVDPVPPDDADLRAALDLAQRSGRARPSILVALAVLLWPTLFYLLDAIRASDANDSLTRVLRQSALSWKLPWIEIIVQIPMTLLLSAIGILTLLLLGLISRQWQTRRALVRMREYTRLIRRKYTVLLYRDEQQRVADIPAKILTYHQGFAQCLDRLTSIAHQASKTLRERAALIGRNDLQDISEYLPVVQSGPQDLYRKLIQPGMPEQAKHDLPALRRQSQELISLSAAVQGGSTWPTDQQMQGVIGSLVLGDASVSEQDPRAGLRFLSYQALRGIVNHVSPHGQMALSFAQMGEIQRRAHLMIKPGYRPKRTLHQESYLITPTQDTGASLALAETITVGGLDEQSVIYTRIASDLWPRVFEDEQVQLQ